MTAAPRAIEVLAWHPQVPGSDSHVGRISADAPPAPDGDWEGRGRCAEVGGDLFYPEDGESAAPALRVCAACEVRARCLDWALETGQVWGVWGGTTERQRQAMRAGRGLEELAA